MTRPTTMMRHQRDNPTEALNGEINLPSGEVDVREDGIRLYEAAARGDKDTVKELLIAKVAVNTIVQVCACHGVRSNYE